MLDTVLNNNIKFNSVTGTLVKSCKKSKIAMCHQKSVLAQSAFDTNRPKMNDKSIQVLQVMLCGDAELLIEYVYEEDFKSDVREGIKNDE